MGRVVVGVEDGWVLSVSLGVPCVPVVGVSVVLPVISVVSPCSVLDTGLSPPADAAGSDVLQPARENMNAKARTIAISRFFIAPHPFPPCARRFRLAANSISRLRHPTAAMHKEAVTPVSAPFVPSASPSGDTLSTVGTEWPL